MSGNGKEIQMDGAQQSDRHVRGEEEEDEASAAHAVAIEAVER